MFLSEFVEPWDGALYSAYNCYARIKYFLEYPKYASILKRNRKFKNKYKGQRCFIILNGPSISEHDLSHLKNEIVFCTNFFYRSDLPSIVHPNFYCWCDSALFKSDKYDEIRNEILQACPEANLLLNIRGYKKGMCLDRIYFLYNKHLANRFGVISNLDSLCSNFTNVALWTINAAIYMGFDKVYILGLDFEPGLDFKHFDDRCNTIDNPTHWDNKAEVCCNYWLYAKAHFESYALHNFARKHFCNIINLNHNSYIRAFPFGNYEDVISELTKQ